MNLLQVMVALAPLLVGPLVPVDPHAPAVLIGVPGACALFWIVAHLRVTSLARRLDRTGNTRLVARADRTLRVATWAAALVVGGSTLTLGYRESVRTIIGDLVLIDEAIAFSPYVLTLLACFASGYAIERRLQDASVLRSLAGGDTLHEPLSRWGYVWDRFRHGTLLPILPVALMVGVSESLQRIDSLGAWVVALGSFSAIALLFLLTPVLIRWVWHTVPLAEGQIHEMVQRVSRAHGIRFSSVLVWITRGRAPNAAVVGAVYPMRTLLLSDALLERLPADEVEAVVAHEVAHARRAHMPWMIALVASFAIAGEFVLARVDSFDATDFALVSLGTLLAAVLALGYVSRRFERQADAFAVQHLSGRASRRGGPRGVTITPEVAGTMARALRRVAHAGGLDPRKFTFRHGSIAGRIGAIHELEGLDSERLPIDRTVWRIKLFVAAALLCAIAFASAQP
ncbi:MAG: M48 family metalloprotease [Planctomycetota bacterium]